MKFVHLLASAFIAVLTATGAIAQTRDFNVPSGELRIALDTFAKQAGVQLVYRVDEIRAAQTKGVSGSYSVGEALVRILEGTGFTTHRDPSGAIAIIRARDPGDKPRPDADKAAVQLEGIVVTAQKRGELVLDVPVPVTAIRAETLTASNQIRLQDYYAKIPSLGLSVTGNGGEPVLNIRGVTTGDITSPTVAITIDDVPYGASVVAIAPPDIDPSQLARVEVLRGPQGTLYGASSIGGLVKFVTADPSPIFSGRAEAGVTSVEGGDKLGYVVRAAVNAPVSDNVAIRASGFTMRNPGYVDNALTGERDINRLDSQGGHVAAMWRPTSEFNVKLAALVQDSERQGTTDVDKTLGSDPRQSALRGTGIYSRSTQAFSATMSALVGRVDLTSITGYSTDELENNLDLSSNAFQRGQAMSRFGVSGVSVPFITDVKKFSQEVRAVVPLGRSASWLIGAFYTDEEIERNNDVVAVDPQNGSRVGLLLRNRFPNTFKESAVFTNVTVDVTDALDVQVGGRSSRNKQSFASIRSGPLSAVFFGADPSILPTVFSSENATTYLLTPRIKLSKDMMVYARVASGYRPGGPNTNCGVSGVPCQYGADKTYNYEIGIKGTALGGSLAIDASVYHIDWRDIQLSVATVVNTTNFGFTDNASRAKSQGVELSAELRPSQSFRVSGWIALNDAELTEDFPGTSPFSGKAGDRLPYSSRVSGSLSVDHQFALWAGVTATVGASASYVDDRKGVFRSAAQVRETFPSYTTVDLRASARRGPWTLNCFVNNVGDERGILRQGLDSINPNFVTYIQPRTFGVALSRTF